jgi:hypothetical protein
MGLLHLEATQSQHLHLEATELTEEHNNIGGCHTHMCVHPPTI